VVSFGPTTTVTIDEIDSDNHTLLTTNNHVLTTALTIHPPAPPRTALNTTNTAVSPNPPTPTLPRLPFSGSTNPDRTALLNTRIADLEAELTAAISYHGANPT